MSNNLSSSRDHILERFDRILGYLSSLDKISDHDRNSNYDKDRNSKHERDRDRGSVRDIDRDRYQHRYRERD